MARIEFTATTLHVALTRGEKIAALHGDVEVPLVSVSAARILPTNFYWKELGFRLPGTGLPPFIVSGTYVKKGDKAFVSYFKGQTPVEITLTGQAFSRLIIGVESEAVANAVLGHF